MSAYLKENLHGLIETVTPDLVKPLMEWTIETHGGYYKRWRGGDLHRWTQWAKGTAPDVSEGMTLEERISLAFLQVRLDYWQTKAD